MAWVLSDSNLHALKFVLELERRQLKEATGHTCSDQRVHSPLTFAFTDDSQTELTGQTCSATATCGQQPACTASIF